MFIKFIKLKLFSYSLIYFLKNKLLDYLHLFHLFYFGVHIFVHIFLKFISNPFQWKFDGK